MYVKCIYNKLIDLKKNTGLFNYLKKGSYGGIDGEFALKIGKIYTVYGLLFKQNYPWFYVCDEKYTYYPMAYVSPLFEIVDNQLSRFWTFGHSIYYSKDGNVKEKYTRLTYDEWATDDYYFDSLTNGVKRDLSLFEKYKELIEIEFPDPSVSLKGSILEGNWVMCPKCDETWEASSLNGILKCPKCMEKMQNPLFDGKRIKIK